MYRLQILCLGDIIMRTRIERIDTNNLYAIFDYFLILRTRIERIDTIFLLLMTDRWSTLFGTKVLLYWMNF